MKKDRNLSMVEFYEMLQKEYFIAEIKSKLYPSRKQKDFYRNRVMEGKRIKILDISNKNNLPNIFDDEETKNEIRDQIYPVIGLPQFDLTNEEIKYYYSVESEVRVEIEDRPRIGKIIDIDFRNNVAYIKFRNSSENQPIKLNKITRIL